MLGVPFLLMKRILILTPIYKRPEIVKLFLQGFRRLKGYYNDLILLCIVSPEDPSRNELIELIYDYGGDVCEYSNKYLGEKKNAGLEFALREYSFDYLMDLGSDDLLNPEIFKLYQPYMEAENPFFGLNNLYVLDRKTGRVIFIRDYNTGHCHGAGRMLHREAIKIPPWPAEANKGLDSLSRERLKNVGVKETVIDSGETPYILDIKTDTNIASFGVLDQYKEKDVKFSEIAGILRYYPGPDRLT